MKIGDVLSVFFIYFLMITGAVWRVARMNPLKMKMNKMMVIDLLANAHILGIMIEEGMKERGHQERTRETIAGGRGEIAMMRGGRDQTVTMKEGREEGNGRKKENKRWKKEGKEEKRGIELMKKLKRKGRQCCFLM